MPRTKETAELRKLKEELQHCKDCREKERDDAIERCYKDRERYELKIKGLDKKIMTLTISVSAAGGLLGKDAMQEIGEITGIVETITDVGGDVVQKDDDGFWFDNIPGEVEFKPWNPNTGAGVLVADNWNDTNVHILSHTLHYGTGVFEGVRAYKTSSGPAIFRLKEHTSRLFKAANKLNIKIPFSEDEINNAQCEILNKNNLDEGYIRPIVYLGNEGLGLRAKDLSVNVAVAAWEWPSYMDPQSKENGISVIKSSHMQYENPLHSGNKIIGTYFVNTMALHEAIDNGADEAIMMDKDGFISEGSGENIFLVKNSKVLTPTTDHCLNGITRQSVIQIGKDLNMEVIEKNIKFEDLVEADEAFFTGTAVEITPITSLNGKLINKGKRGKITQQLQEKFQEITQDLQVNEAVEGTMVNLFYDKRVESWEISTRTAISGNYWWTYKSPDRKPEPHEKIMQMTFRAMFLQTLGYHENTPFKPECKFTSLMPRKP